MLPKPVINWVGSSSWLAPLRKKLLRGPQGMYRMVGVEVVKAYRERPVKFMFHANYQTAEIAKNKGIENTLLRNTLELLSKGGIKQDALVLDIGANFGYLSLVWSQTIALGKGWVHSFEPNPYVADAFSKSIEKSNIPNISLHQVAVGRVSGNIDLNIFDTSSNVTANPQFNEKKRVPLVTIDDFCKDQHLTRCDLIKIDVDGIEAEILEGASETILKFKPVLIVETNGDERILKKCAKWGYSLYNMALEPVNPEEREIPMNLFCIAEKG